ncbi:MAG: NAD(P)-dependent glycerol-3-phosphate dehydrogenase [Candidatus Eisenbacteria bacterium]|uniref:Glycerol-3-phosphate dehydrogenase [NAD(P)+] n=1 Tax=Eiseniibacteriota bacterium TaxID=2212470 RepID=A0A538SI41_UNCEI|nr:MAG: NAD(P)-dependent glycerol-3-phosphate dehydrogenase [Candidatus Eisenbacteria bacterium]
MKIGILGGGGWGTTLALLLDSRDHEVRLWVYEADETERMRRTRENTTFLPGVRIPDRILITNSQSEAVRNAEAIVIATPSRVVRDVARKLLEDAGPELKGIQAIVSGSKGLEPKTLLRMSEVLAQVLPERSRSSLVVLTGPSHAEEVSRRVPTAVVAASSDPASAGLVQEAFSTEWFRVYTNDDVAGVEIAAALKNVVAIAAGICDGLGFGDSTKGALLTRGLVEIARLGEALGARPATFSGLAGMGDLIATAMSRHSRNRRLGEAIGKGMKLEEALAASKMVVEGVGTAHAAVDLSRRHGVELPIAEQVRAILFEGKSATAAIRELLTRDLKAEPRALTRR